MLILSLCVFWQIKCTSVGYFSNRFHLGIITDLFLHLLYRKCFCNLFFFLFFLLWGGGSQFLSGSRQLNISYLKLIVPMTLRKYQHTKWERKISQNSCFECGFNYINIYLYLILGFYWYTFSKDPCPVWFLFIRKSHFLPPLLHGLVPSWQDSGVSYISYQKHFCVCHLIEEWRC